MQQYLARNRSCPSCKKARITALKDVVLRNQIMKVEATKTSNSRKRKASSASSDEKWTGKYDELSTHMKQCDFELFSIFFGIIFKD